MVTRSRFTRSLVPLKLCNIHKLGWLMIIITRTGVDDISLFSEGKVYVSSLVKYNISKGKTAASDSVSECIFGDFFLWCEDIDVLTDCLTEYYRTYCCKTCASGKGIATLNDNLSPFISLIFRFVGWYLKVLIKSNFSQIG